MEKPLPLLPLPAPVLVFAALFAIEYLRINIRDYIKKGARTSARER